MRAYCEPGNCVIRQYGFEVGPVHVSTVDPVRIAPTRKRNRKFHFFKIPSWTSHWWVKCDTELISGVVRDGRLFVIDGNNLAT